MKAFTDKQLVAIAEEMVELAAFMYSQGYEVGMDDMPSGYEDYDAWYKEGYEAGKADDLEAEYDAGYIDGFARGKLVSDQMWLCGDHVVNTARPPWME